MYPARMFTLPVTVPELAGWPMLFATTAMAILWLATRLFAVWPSGVVGPLVWPALFAAVLLARTQALVWMPYPSPGLRVIVTILRLAGIAASGLLALYYQVPEAVMLAILVPHLPVAYLAACLAVARSRHGRLAESIYTERTNRG
ncbi:MAG: hypothetical protein HYV63_24755 [Candidatus Schekmanbacteria bacterium]|nr:hypothetical protein [Candidatus Schekmanbacteria bacterium]